MGHPLRHAVVLAVALATVASTSAHAAPPSPRPVTLEQLSPIPNSGDTAMPILFRSGWPLIFRASVKGKDMLGLGRVYGGQGEERHGWPFPEVGQGGAVVFSDPDASWSYVFTAFNEPHDELIMPFHPDSGDISGTNDDVASAPLSHDVAAKTALRPEFGGPLAQTALYPAPPPGYFQPDGVQFGSDDDLPGLVVLSNVGVGIVTTPLADGWQPVLPRAARNLAGFSNSVGYELNDRLGRTSVTSTMIVPRFLFSHIRLLDPCVGTVTYNEENEPISCEGPRVQRIDGGPIVPEAPNDEAIVELRAFVVGPAWNPVTNQVTWLDTLADTNGDGLVTAADVAGTPHKLLSNEIVFRFRQIGSDTSVPGDPYGFINYCNGGFRPDGGPGARVDFQYDVDGNGQAVIKPFSICPGGGSGVTQPPR